MAQEYISNRRSWIRAHFSRFIAQILNDPLIIFGVNDGLSQKGKRYSAEDVFINTFDISAWRHRQSDTRGSSSNGRKARVFLFWILQTCKLGMKINNFMNLFPVHQRRPWRFKDPLPYRFRTGVCIKCRGLRNRILPRRTEERASTISFWLTPQRLAVSFSHFLWQFTSHSVERRRLLARDSGVARFKIHLSRHSIIIIPPSPLDHHPRPRRAVSGT